MKNTKLRVIFLKIFFFEKSHIFKNFISRNFTSKYSYKVYKDFFYKKTYKIRKFYYITKDYYFFLYKKYGHLKRVKVTYFKNSNKSKIFNLLNVNRKHIFFSIFYNKINPVFSNYNYFQFDDIIFELMNIFIKLITFFVL